MSGKVDITSDPNGTTTISLNGGNATITAGGNGQHGIVSLKDETTVAPRILLNAKNGTFIMTRPETATWGTYTVIGFHADRGDVGIGGNGQDGDLVLFPAAVQGAAPVDDKTRATIHLRASDGIIRTGGGGVVDGQILVLGKDNSATVHLRASDGVVRAGGNGVDGRILVLGSDNSERITLDGKAGDIFLQNADCAEEFDVSECDAIDAGTVMIIDQDSVLRPSSVAYDKRVAGVVSGACDCKPAITLDKKPSQRRRLPLALFGKVFCKSDAEYSPIAVGDLLTTSPTLGHAMKATDPLSAFGAVIGKALLPLDTGTGLIPILIALQ